MRILIDTHTNLYPLSRLPGGVVDRIKDRRRIQAPVDFTFHGQLKDFQEMAVEAMADRDFGTLAAPTSGKRLWPWVWPSEPIGGNKP